MWFKEYLEKTGYTNISKAKETYDMVGLNPKKIDSFVK